MLNPSSHPAAPHHIPFYLPGPDGSDPIMVATGIFLIIGVLAFGLLLMRIHMLPDHIAHRGHKIQLEIVAVLGLLSMFTGVHAFWVAALLLALIDIPDFTGPLRRIAGSAETIAGLLPGAGDTTDGQRPAHDAAHDLDPHPSRVGLDGLALPHVAVAPDVGGRTRPEIGQGALGHDRIL
jgi:hypothetical protein